MPQDVKSMSTPWGAALISGCDILKIEVSPEVARGRKWLLETMASKPGIHVIQVDDRGTSVAGQKAGAPEDDEPLRLCAPPNWAWRTVTVKTLKLLVQRWYDTRMRKNAQAAINRLGLLGPEPKDVIEAMLSKHGWEKADESVWRFPELDHLAGAGGGDAQAGVEVAGDLSAQVR